MRSVARVTLDACTLFHARLCPNLRSLKAAECWELNTEILRNTTIGGTKSTTRE